jgi:hypothetical protein
LFSTIDRNVETQWRRPNRKQRKFYAHNGRVYAQNIKVSCLCETWVQENAQHKKSSNIADHIAAVQIFSERHRKSAGWILQLRQRCAGKIGTESLSCTGWDGCHVRYSAHASPVFYTHDSAVFHLRNHALCFLLGRLRYVSYFCVLRPVACIIKNIRVLSRILEGDGTSNILGSLCLSMHRFQLHQTKLPFPLTFCFPTLFLMRFMRSKFPFWMKNCVTSCTLIWSKCV